MLNFDYQCNFKEFAIACFFLTCQSKFLRIIFIIVMLINLATLTLQAKTHHHLTPENILDFFFPLLILATILIISPIIQFRRIKGKTVTLQITEQNLMSKMNTMSSEIGWDNILKVAKVGDMLGFFYTRNCAYLLPLRLVNPIQTQAIEQLCQRKNIPFKF